MTSGEIKTARRVRSGWGVWTTCLLVSVFPCLLVSLSFCEEPEGLPVFRRQLLTPERLPQELKRVQDGVLVRLPLAEFDARVERAARASARKVPPRLLEARYHAVLKEESLIGEARWKVFHKGPAPGLMNLEPFNLAVRQTRFQNGDALIATFDDRTPALLVETVGEQTVSLEWSARAEAGPEGLRFLLAVPPSPVALLELDVPAGREVILLGASDGVLLTGPYPADKADFHRWKIACRGRNQIDFRVRPTAQAAPRTEGSPVAFVRQTTTQKLYLEGLDATFELSLETLPEGIRELVCECDPELRPRDVLGPSVDGCSFQPGDGKTPSRFTIRLREPLREGTWKILCLAPLDRSPTPAGTAQAIAWRSPSLRLIGGVPRGETLSLWLDPDLRVESWSPGSFRLVHSSSGSDPDRPGKSMRHLTLVGGGLGPEEPAAHAPPSRPEARLQAHGVEFRARQLAWWRCDSTGMTLNLQIGYEVSQGQLFQLPVLLPAGWSVERVEMSPANLLRNWRFRPAAQMGRSMLVVELTHPLAGTEGARREDRIRPRRLVNPEGQAESTSRPTSSGRSHPPTLTVQLRPSQSSPMTGAALPLPDAVPLGARFREGALVLDCDERLFHLDVQTAADRSEPEEDGPWGKQPPEYYYRYRGQEVSGTLRVRPRPPRLRAQCGSEVFVASGRAAVETHLLLEAEVGSPETIDLSLSDGDGEPWQWHTEPGARGETAISNRVLRAERLYAIETTGVLPVLGAHDPLQAAVLLAARPNGERWRLTLARPLRAGERLRLLAKRSLRPRENRWHVPLPVVLGAGRMEGEVTLHLAGADLVQVQTIGLREAVSAAADGATPWRTFRYGPTEVALTLWGQALAAGRASEAAIDRARLTTYVGATGILRHHLSFQVANWGQRTLPLRLPPGVQPLAIGVDGHWLPRLLSTVPAAEEGDPSGASAELPLPVPAHDDAPGEAVHRFEVIYTSAAPAWRPWQSIAAPAPVLPLPPLAFRRSWRLAPSLTPLRQEHYQPIPGMGDDFESAAWPRRPSDLFDPFAAWPRFDALVGDRQGNVHEALARAAEGLRGRRPGQAPPLREVVNEIAFLHLRDRYPLVVDTLALREVGIGLNTSVTIKPLSSDDATPPWAGCGLVTVPVRSAVLLTTASGRGAVLREPLPKSLEETIEAAVTRGQDPSGRFRSALSWLRPENVLAAAPPPPALLGLGSDLAGWSEWEPVAGLPDETLLVVRRDQMTGVGLGPALLLGLFFWTVRRRSARYRLAFLLLTLALTGLGLLWLPSALRDLAWWPLLATGIGALGWYLQALTRSEGKSTTENRKSKSSAAAVATAIGLLLAAFGWGGRAEAPAPVIVYLVPGPAEAPENQTVLAPADFLDRLQELARPGPLVAGGPKAVLLGATYEGKLADGQAEFAAVFAVECLTEEPTTLAVPLDGVHLVGDVWLDGVRADPLALPLPQTGYSVKVRGRGRHKLVLHFRVPVTGTHEDRNVLFTVPPLVQSRLTWHVPSGAVATQALTKHGGQWTVCDAGSERLEADLGRLPARLHLHWYQPAHPARPSRVRYQAAYLWDLNLEASVLTAWLRYRVLEGAVQTLDVDLPADLEVRSASAQRTLPVIGRAPDWLGGIRLRHWRVLVAGGKRTLRLEFPYPVSGDFQITVELLPRTPLPSRVTLSLPQPHGERSWDLHYLAYRTHPGLDAAREASQNITRIGDNEFAPGWSNIVRPEPRYPGAAYKIALDSAPVLRLHLRRSPPVLHAELDISIQAGLQLAQIQATAELKAPNKDLGVVEWDLQSSRFTVASVTGSKVRAWKQTDRRLLVWLHQTTDEAQLTLSGWLPLQRQGGQPHLDLAGPRLTQAREQHTVVHLAAAADLTLAAVQPHNLQPIQGAAEHEQTFETRQTLYGIACQVQAVANIARVLTFAEVNDRRLQFTTTVNYEVKHGELRRVILRLRNGDAWTIEEPQADRVAQRRALRRKSDRSWLLDLQPGVTGRYRVTLRGSISIENAAVGVLLPDISVQGVEHAEYIVAVGGSELTGETRGGLIPLVRPAQELSDWPGVAGRVERAGGEGWRIGGPEWQLRLLPHPRATELAQVRVFLLEQSAAVVDGQRWLHEARCWLRHEAHTDLNVDFPAPVRVIAAAVDGVEVTPLQSSRSRLWLPLPGRAGVRCVRLRWQYDQAEPLDRPNLEPPNVADAQKGPALWTVLVPPGWELVRNTLGTRLGTGAAREAALALYRAEAQLHISQELCQQTRDAATSVPLANAQRRFALYCRHAQHALDMGGNRGGVTGPAGQTLAQWLLRLQADNRELASQNGFPEASADAEASEEAAEPDASADDDSVARFTGPGGGRLGGTARPLPQRGTPISWQSQPGAEPPALQLDSHEAQRTRRAMTASGQWLGVLAIVWILSFLPFLLARLRPFWPEQIALFGVLGWHLAGLTLIVLFLLLVAVSGRLFLLGRALRSLLPKRKSQPSTATAGSGVGS